MPPLRPNKFLTLEVPPHLSDNCERCKMQIRPVIQKQLKKINENVTFQHLKNGVSMIFHFIFVFFYFFRFLHKITTKIIITIIILLLFYITHHTFKQIDQIYELVNNNNLSVIVKNVSSLYFASK